MEGVVISAGHQARVNTALAFEPAVSARIVKANNDSQTQQNSATQVTYKEPLVRPVWAASKTTVQVSLMPSMEVTIAAEPLMTMLPFAKPHGQPDPQATPILDESES